MTISLILTVLLPSCVSKSEPVYIYRQLDLPEPPIFPAPVDENDTVIAVYDDVSDTVTVPLWWWLNLADFKADYDAFLKKIDSKYDSK